MVNSEYWGSICFWNIGMAKIASKKPLQKRKYVLWSLKKRNNELLSFPKTTILFLQSWTFLYHFCKIHWFCTDLFLSFESQLYGCEMHCILHFSRENPLFRPKNSKIRSKLCIFETSGAIAAATSQCLSSQLRINRTFVNPPEELAKFGNLEHLETTRQVLKVVIWS